MIIHMKMQLKTCRLWKNPPLYGMVDNEEITSLCSKYKIEVQSWLKLATEVMDTQEMQVA